MQTLCPAVLPIYTVVWIRNLLISALLVSNPIKEVISMVSD